MGSGTFSGTFSGKMFVIALPPPPCYHSLMKTLIRKPTKPRYTFNPPTLYAQPPCDFRMDFDAGMTLKQIAARYHCDQRTVRTCILLNKSSSELGRQYAPTKIAPFAAEAESLYWKMTQKEAIPLTQASRKITMILAERGYTGSERTIRNYLKAHCAAISVIKSESSLLSYQEPLFPDPKVKE